VDSSDELWQFKEWMGKLSGSQRLRKRVWQEQRLSVYVAWTSRPTLQQSVVWLVSAARYNASSAIMPFDMGGSRRKANRCEAELPDMERVGKLQDFDGSRWRFPAQTIRTPDSVSVNDFIPFNIYVRRVWISNFLI
jgi:hypothetical protein